MARPFTEVERGAVRIIYRSDAALDSSLIGVFWVADDFERLHPLVVQRMVNAVVRFAARNSDERNRDIITAAWKAIGLREDEIEKSWSAQPIRKRYSPLLDEHFVASLHRSVTDVKRFEFITSDISIDGWVEPRYLNRALEELNLQGYWPEFDAAGNPKRAK